MVNGKDVEGIDYADLEVMYLGARGSRVQKHESAVHLEPVHRVLDKSDEWTTVIDVVRKPGRSDRDEDLAIIQRSGPWIPEILPEWIRNEPVTMISRKVSVEEVDDLVEQIVDDEEKVAALIRWGVLKVASRKQMIEMIREKAFPEDLAVRENVAWTVLRQEFGIRGPAHPHIRESLALDRTEIKRLIGDVADHALNGAPNTHRSSLDREERTGISWFEDQLGISSGHVDSLRGNR